MASVLFVVPDKKAVGGDGCAVGFLTMIDAC